MFVTTFYSFKGGVGRTLALMNVARSLIQKGKRVLLVDFDLEAPGLTTFELTRSAQFKPGIVEFVSDYLKNGIAPEVGNYVHEITTSPGFGSLFVMPSGIQDSSYGARLAEVDWGALYENETGFLLLEDLRAQWASHCDPDYVLIDSRTGHTDVGGICTRQLPDAVVVLFFPNDQNLVGLSTVVGAIKASSVRPVDLLFVPSNVPDIDDEEAILAEWLAKFRAELGYSESAAIIHHNTALALLNQVLYVDVRPNSALAKEYRALTASIQRANVNDQEGAESRLDKLIDEILDRKGGGVPPQLVELELDKLTEHHSKQPGVLEKALQIRLLLGSNREALRLLNLLIEDGLSDKAQHRFRRAAIRSLSESDADAAVEDLVVGMDSPTATYFDLSSAMPVIARLRQYRLYKVMLESAAFKHLSEESQVRLVRDLSERAEAQEEIKEPVFRLWANASDDSRKYLRHCQFVICLGTGHPKEARAVFLSEPTHASPIDDRYNFCIAVWADSGEIRTDLLSGVLADQPPEAMKHEHMANYYQCMAFAANLLGLTDRALEYIGRARSAMTTIVPRDFSTWRYSQARRPDFLSDLDEMTRWISGESVLPLFLEGRSQK